jgi:hypothetical protein
MDSQLILEADGRFGNGAIREQLTGPAVEAVLRIAAAWKLTNAESAGLLGVAVAAWRRMKSGQWRGALGQDQLTRASILIALHASLHELIADERADHWPRQVTRENMFCGLSPARAMIHGGIPFMIEVRRYIEAMRNSHL